MFFPHERVFGFTFWLHSDCPVLSNPFCIQLIPSYKYPSRLQKYLHNPIYADVELAGGVEGPRALFVRPFSDLTDPNPYFYYVYGEIYPRDFAYEAGHLASNAGYAGNPVNISGWAPISVCLPLRLLLFVANVFLLLPSFSIKTRKELFDRQRASLADDCFYGMRAIGLGGNVNLQKNKDPLRSSISSPKSDKKQTIRDDLSRGAGNNKLDLMRIEVNVEIAKRELWRRWKLLTGTDAPLLQTPFVVLSTNFFFSPVFLPCV